MMRNVTPIKNKKNPMKEEIEIIDAGEATYLSEVFDDLPDNCVFNKVLTGCGGTTVALTNDAPYVIAVPYLNLISSIKTWAEEQDKDILYVQGGVTIEDIRNYKGKKIVTTWDSLRKVLEVINPLEWKLLVDEYHTLLEAAAFRRSAIDNVLNNFKRFKSYVFMSATPLEDRYQIEELKDLKKVSMKFSSVQRISVTWSAFDNSLTDHLYLLIRRHLTGELPENAHIFINSVSLITKILKQVRKSDKQFLKDFRVVCANNTANETKLKTASKSLKIDSVNSEVKKINFYTATAFEGCNIYDENSISYIVTDGNLDHTKINLFTTLPQIVGRIRDSINKNRILILYTPDKVTSSLTVEEFELSVRADLKSAGKIVDQYKQVKDLDLDKAVEAFKLGYKDCAFIYTNDQEEIVVNDLYWKSQMHMFSTLHKVYHVKNVADVNIKQNANIIYSIVYRNLQQYSDLSSIDKLKLDKKPKYTDIFRAYIDLKESIKPLKYRSPERLAIEEEIKIIEGVYKEFISALGTLGADKIKALNYQKSKVKKEMILVDGKKRKELKIVELLNYQPNMFISAADVKAKLQTIYNQLNLDTKVSATSIEDYYKVNHTTKRIDGKVTRGFEIIYSLFQ